MEIGQLEAFIQVASLNSFSRAAEALYLTQPTVTARIQALERELGEELFERASRGVRLTDAGRAFWPYAQQVLQALKDGQAALEAARRATRGRLDLGVARVISIYVLPRILHEFRLRYPGVDVSVKTGRSHEILEMVLSGEVQLALTRTLAHPEIASRHLYDEEIVPVVYPGHTFARRCEASIFDIICEPLILYDAGSTYYVTITDLCREANILPNVVMNLDSVEATKKMVELGLGISFLPRNSLERELEAGTLVAIRVTEGTAVKLPTSVSYRTTKRMGAIASAFLQVVQDLFPWAEAPSRGVSHVTSHQ
ncbi:MAG: LysR family transcriptional regulator [Chloroflexi bacterium]|nr:LysR family transcriptional regulator [Chloroflexota bacterium]